MEEQEWMGTTVMLQSAIGYVLQEDFRCDGADLQLQLVLRSNGEGYILEWVRWGLK